LINCFNNKFANLQQCIYYGDSQLFSDSILYNLYDKERHKLLIKATFAFKNIQYASEKEWRLVIFPRYLNDLKLKSGFSQNIPYLELDLKKFHIPVKEIIIGPGPNQDHDKQALDFIKKNYNIDSIIKSSVPYAHI
jgi:hypothetical protein